MDNGLNGFNDNNDVQNELQRLIQEINRIRISNRNRNNINSRTRRNTDNNDIVVFLRELLYLYNTNFREYQENMRLMIETMYLLASNNINASPNRNNTTNERRPTYDNEYLYYSLFPNINRFTRPVTPINTFNENVIVRPTNNQLDSATINYEYNAETSQYNTNCPITLEEFQEGEQVCRIRHCGHTFRRDAINNWFQGNVRCPVCRYDIRDYSVDNSTPETQEGVASQPENNNQSLTDEEMQINLRNRISNSLMNIINEYYSETDLSNNLVYTFEFPVIYNDISANFTRLR
jgi:hypothetical protein